MNPSRQITLTSKEKDFATNLHSAVKLKVDGILKNMKPSTAQIQVKDLNHYGIIAGIIDELGLVGKINELVGTHYRQKVTPGIAVKAMIINGLGMFSAPLYLFEKFFEGKATEHLLGEGILPEHLNDDCLGRVWTNYLLKG
ncbi:MAG: hypothetical protein Tsb0014_40110 [Pleurocapsa sp.]